MWHDCLVTPSNYVYSISLSNVHCNLDNPIITNNDKLKCTIENFTMIFPESFWSVTMPEFPPCRMLIFAFRLAKCKVLLE